MSLFPISHTEIANADGQTLTQLTEVVERQYPEYEEYTRAIVYQCHEYIDRMDPYDENRALERIRDVAMRIVARCAVGSIIEST